MGSISRDEEPVEVEETPEIFSVQKQVLIVEDESVNQLLLGNALRDQYGVLFAADGLEAMEQIRTVKNDLALVLLDLQMPRMGGLEVLRGIKDDPDLRRIPVIVLTADQEAEVECLKIGAMDFIPKPYPDIEIIKARISKCIELAENRDLIRRTQRDKLTGLYNIDYFLRYVNRYDQHYEGMAFDAVVCDINEFYSVNDQYGRQFGDLVLRSIGIGISKLARKIGGIGCRKEGDTFLLYCPHQEDYEQLLSKLLEDLFLEEDTSNKVKLRFGVFANAHLIPDIEARFDRAKEAADSAEFDPDLIIGYVDD
jgi:diguanylate cyclase (GGDEF)-like protein